MKIKKLKNSNDGVVGIIVAVLLIGLILAVISLIQTVFVPNWMEQIEADHMGEVSDQFAQLKFAIDIQTVLNKTDIPVAVPITLGSNNLPYLKSAKANGILEIIPNNVTFSIDDDNLINKDYGVGIIRYSSINVYFLNQVYNYESGAVIISQDEGDIMTTLPNFDSSINSSKVDTIDIEFTIVDIEGVGNKLSASGFGNFPIQVEYFSTDTNPYSNVSYINITSDNYESWEIHINNTLRNEGLIWDSNYTIHPPSGNTISIQFINNYKADMIINEIKINAQIAPGWIDT